MKIFNFLNFSTIMSFEIFYLNWIILIRKFCYLKKITVTLNFEMCEPVLDHNIMETWFQYLELQGLLSTFCTQWQLQFSVYTWQPNNIVLQDTIYESRPSSYREVWTSVNPCQACEWYIFNLVRFIPFRQPKFLKLILWDIWAAELKSAAFCVLRFGSTILNSINLNVITLDSDAVMKKASENQLKKR